MLYIADPNLALKINRSLGAWGKQFLGGQVQHDVNFPLVASFLATFAANLPFKLEVEAQDMFQLWDFDWNDSPKHWNFAFMFFTQQNLEWFIYNSSTSWQLALTYASKKHLLNPHFREDFEHQALNSIIYVHPNALNCIIGILFIRQSISYYKSCLQFFCLGGMVSNRRIHTSRASCLCDAKIQQIPKMQAFCLVQIVVA